VARIRASELGTVAVQRQHLAQTRLVPGRVTHLAKELRFKNGEALLEGRGALRVGGILMPHVNRYGGDKEALQFAVKALDDAGGADDYLRNLSKYASDATEVPLGYSNKPRSEKSWTGAYTSGLFGLSTPDRLALEMALHEEAELRALRGELSELERAWRDAEEIAAIADNMLMPPSIQATLDEPRHTNEPREVRNHWLRAASLNPAVGLSRVEMKYEEMSPISRDEAVDVLASGDTERISVALIRLALHDRDRKWYRSNVSSWLRILTCGLDATAQRASAIWRACTARLILPV
jgi:hypothetical protein